MWRPKDWNGQSIAFKEADRIGDFGMTPSYQDMVEAGADAILKEIIQIIHDSGIKRKKALVEFLDELTHNLKDLDK